MSVRVPHFLASSVVFGAEVVKQFGTQASEAGLGYGLGFITSAARVGVSNEVSPFDSPGRATLMASSSGLLNFGLWIPNGSGAHATSPRNGLGRPSFLSAMAPT